MKVKLRPKTFYLFGMDFVKEIAPFVSCYKVNSQLSYKNNNHQYQLLSVVLLYSHYSVVHIWQ